MAPPPLEGGHQPSVAGVDHDPGVAVVELQAVVVLGHDERAADVPVRAGGETLDLGREPALDVSHPRRHALGPAAVRAQEPEAAQRVDGAARASPGPRRLDDGAPAVDREPRARRRGAVGRRRPRPRRSAIHSHVRVAAPRGSPSPRRRRPAGWPRPARRWHRRSGGRRRSTTIPSPIGARARRRRRRNRLPGDGGQLLARRRAACRPSDAGPDDVAQDGAGLDRGQLLGVADEDQAGVGADRLDQPGHQRERDHGRLVDHDHVVGQPVQAVVAEAGAVARVEAEQPVQRHARAARRRRSRSRPRRPAWRRRPARTASSSRAAALPVGAARATSGGRRPAADACSSSRARTRATVVVLPVPGPAGDHRQPAQHGRGRRQALEVRVVVAVEEARRGPRRSRSASTPPARRLASAPAGRAPPGCSSAQSRSRYRVVPSRCSGRSSPTSGLLGQPAEPRPPGRATAARRGRAGVSGSALAVARMVARSTHTWPSRGARAAKAAPRQTTSSSASRRAGRAAAPRGRRTSTRTPASVELARASPPRAERQPGVEGVDVAGSTVVTARPRSKRSLSGLDQRGRRAPGPDAAGLARPTPAGSDGAHAAHEQVEDAAEVARRARSRAGASAGSGAAPPSRAGPAAGSGRPPSRPAGPRAGSARP